MSDMTSPQKEIRIIGNIIVALDECRSRLDRGTAERNQLDAARDDLDAYQRKLVDIIIDTNTEGFRSHAASLEAIHDELLVTIGDLDRLAETLNNLVRFVEVADKIIATSVFSVEAVSAAMIAKSAAFPEMRTHFMAAAAKVEVQPGIFAEEKAAPLPVEEVLHGVELTPDKLIITVATGGCTGEESFHVEVHKGYAGLPPCLVTVYRIASDGCSGKFEPMKIAFSREKLGLDGLVEFILRNKIGNTSHHRLVG